MIAEVKRFISIPAPWSIKEYCDNIAITLTHPFPQEKKKQGKAARGKKSEEEGFANYLTLHATFKTVEETSISFCKIIKNK